MKSSIRSIGWLHGAAGTVILTPVFEGSSHPVKVRIPQAEFAAVSHSKDLMKAKAITALGRA